MDFPEFPYIRASTFYMHRNPDLVSTDKPSLNRHINTHYTFHYFHKDSVGGIEVDGVFHHATANCFSLAKPQQTMNY